MTECACGREPITLVQIDQDFCNLTYGTSPCTADQANKCYNTRKTCQDPENYDRGTLTLTFCTPTVSIPRDQNWLPFIQSVSTAPTKINPSTGNLNKSPLGERGVLTVSFLDSPYSDLIVDPYVADRSFDPLERSTFWAKWQARNPYYQNRLVRLYEGYIGDDIDDMRVRHYLLESVTGPGSGNTVKLVAKDPLKLSEKERAQIPVASSGELRLDIDSAVVEFEVGRAELADYDAVGAIRIGDEIITYTSTSIVNIGTIDYVKFSGCTRGQYGTEADEHDSEDAVQKCIIFEDVPVWEIVRDLLVDYAEVDPAYINESDWEDEHNLYLAQFNVSAILSEPESVFDALAELSQQMPFYIWWDDRNNTIRFKAVRYYVGDYPIINEDKILENSFSTTTNPRDRVSQVWVYHTPRDWSQDERSNYKGVEVNANLELESRDLYDEQKIRIIEARWLTKAQAFNLTSRLIRANYDNPVYGKLRLDAKDEAYWTGDIVDVNHRSIVDFEGNPITYRYQIISSKEAISGETIEHEIIRLITLTVKTGRYMESDAPQWADATELEKESGAWYADANGFLPTDVPGYEYE